METLIASLDSKGIHWGQIEQVIKKNQWKRIILIGSFEINEFQKRVKHNCEFINIDLKTGVEEIILDLTKKFKEIQDLEVGVNIVSGDGKLHTALLSSLMNAALGFKLVAVTKNGFKVL